MALVEPPIGMDCNISFTLSYLDLYTSLLALQETENNMQTSLTSPLHETEEEDLHSSVESVWTVICVI